MRFVCVLVLLAACTLGRIPDPPGQQLLRTPVASSRSGFEIDGYLELSATRVVVGSRKAPFSESLTIDNADAVLARLHGALGAVVDPTWPASSACAQPGAPAKRQRLVIRNGPAQPGDIVAFASDDAPVDQLALLGGTLGRPIVVGLKRAGDAPRVLPYRVCGALGRATADPASTIDIAIGPRQYPGIYVASAGGLAAYRYQRMTTLDPDARAEEIAAAIRAEAFNQPIAGVRIWVQDVELVGLLGVIEGALAVDATTVTLELGRRDPATKLEARLSHRGAGGRVGRTLERMHDHVAACYAQAAFRNPMLAGTFAARVLVRNSTMSLVTADDVDPGLRGCLGELLASRRVDGREDDTLDVTLSLHREPHDRAPVRSVGRSPASLHGCMNDCD